MPLPGIATADTLPVSSKLARGGDDKRQLGTAASALREHLSHRQGQVGEIVREVATRASRLGQVARVHRQHDYQRAAFVTDHAVSRVQWTTSALAAGVYRMELSVPARLRQWRWRMRCAFRGAGTIALPLLASRRAQRLARRVLPLVVVLGATAACSLVSQDGGGGYREGGPLPSLSKKKVVAPNETEGRRDAPWNYVLPVDHGVRVDRSGKGNFRAPRFHGEHNGLDLLAPVGTPTYSPCKGEAMTGVSRSFGRWVHVICPVPDAYMKAGGPRPWASFFFAHLDETKLPHDKWVDVTGGQKVGTVGKTGNARGPNVQPHLHLEFIVQKNHRHAMDEHHLGSDQSSVPAADYFAEALSTECMTPYGFGPKSQLVRRARRIDPFVALTCLSEKKPNFQKPPSPLSEASLAWTRFYEAKDFNVNLGVEDSRVARK